MIHLACGTGLCIVLGVAALVTGITGWLFRPCPHAHEDCGHCEDDHDPV